MKKIIATSILVLTSSFFVFSFNDVVKIHEQNKEYKKAEQSIVTRHIGNYTEFKKELFQYNYSQKQFEVDKKMLLSYIKFDGQKHLVKDNTSLSTFFYHTQNFDILNSSIPKKWDIPDNDIDSKINLSKKLSKDETFEHQRFLLKIMMLNVGNEWSDWSNSFFKEKNISVSFVPDFFNSPSAMNYISYLSLADFKKELEKYPNHNEFLNFIYDANTGKISDEKIFTLLKTISFVNSKISDLSYLSSLKTENRYNIKEYNKTLFLR